jgi:hypothetical protein
MIAHDPMAHARPEARPAVGADDPEGASNVTEQRDAER